MDILAASYKHIGPFVDNQLSVHFSAGTYLISAPIGTGKSFLFFDGPVFGLYKHSRRPILNRAASQGQVLVIFVVADQVWAVERNLTATKAGGEGVRSRFFTSSLSEDEWVKKLDQIFLGKHVLHDVSLGEIFAEYLEEVSFHSQKELDQSVLDLLPPREVVLSTNFLLQDAPNVFELPPAERVVVFKHLFGLLGIDEAKDKLAEKRREIQTTIKVKQDTTNLDAKLASYLLTVKKSITSLRSMQSGMDDLQPYLQGLWSFPLIQDLTLVEDNLQIASLKLDQLPLEIGEKLQAYVDGQQTSYSQKQGVVQQIDLQLREYHNKKEQLVHRKKGLSDEAEKIKDLLNQDLDKSRQQVLSQKQDLQKQQQALLSSVSIDNFKVYGYEVESLDSANTVILELQQQGKLLKQTALHLQEKLAQGEKQKEQLLLQQEKLGQQQQQLQLNSEEQKRFHCDKIDGDCPYVEMIKGASIKTLQRQEELLQQQTVDVAKQLEVVGDTVSTLTGECEKSQAEITQLADTLKNLGWREIAAAVETNKTLMNNIQSCEKQLQQYEAMEAAQKANKERLLEVQAEIRSLESQLLELESLSAQLQETYLQHTTQLQESQVPHLQSIYKEFQRFAESYAQMVALSQEWADQQLAIKQLEVQEVKIKQLYQIFAKELLFYVVKDFLPQLEELINTLLYQLVSYTVSFHLPESLDEKMELNIEIHDEKGVRSVKSLSGGQLVVLKLVWILAVGRLMRVQCMFLDETINNLDADAIGRVAGLLEDYVTGNKLKLYVVTHSPQIQGLAIWDQKIEL